MTMRLRIVHQWFLDPVELSSLLLGTPGRIVETRFCPNFTDCSESLALLDEEAEAGLHPGLVPLVEGWRRSDRGEVMSVSGEGIDRRIVSIGVEASDGP